jgi:hypothetical protein
MHAASVTRALGTEKQQSQQYRRPTFAGGHEMQLNRDEHFPGKSVPSNAYNRVCARVTCYTEWQLHERQS